MIKHIGFLALVLAPILAPALAHADDIKWLTDEKAAFAQAKASHQIVMVDIYSTGDPYSRRFDEGTLKDPAVVELAKQVVALRSDPTKTGRSLAIKYAVNGYPTVLFLSSTGEVISKLVGYEPGPDFAEAVQVALDSAKEFTAVQGRAAKNPKDGEADAKYAVFLSAQTDPTTGKAPAGGVYLDRALASSYRGPYLVMALEAVGDAYATVPGKESVAINYYEKAIDLSKTPSDKAKAMIGVMYLKMDTDKPAAKALAQKIIDLKGATPDWVYAAKEALADLNKG